MALIRFALIAVLIVLVVLPARQGIPRRRQDGGSRHVPIVELLNALSRYSLPLPG